MKKCVAIVLTIAILAVAIFVGFLCGCKSSSLVVATNTDIAKPGTTNVTLTEVDASQFPDAYAHDVYSWPTFGLGIEIPIPTWSNRGCIWVDEADGYRCEVGYTTSENFNDYKQAVRDAGFTLNYKNASDAYYAENEDGIGILIVYSDYWYEMEISVGRNEYLEELREYVG